MGSALMLFLSTPSARRATLRPWASWQRPAISIHALREEGDRSRGQQQGVTKVFLSTPSARRATHDHAEPKPGMDISIHALREEGDDIQTCKGSRHDNFYPRPPRGGRPSAVQGDNRPKIFLSTPSARRATTEAPQNLAELHFYPRPPRGGRPSMAYRCVSNWRISIHALREEGDP